MLQTAPSVWSLQGPMVAAVEMERAAAARAKVMVAVVRADVREGVVTAASRAVAVTEVVRGATGMEEAMGVG